MYRLLLLLICTFTLSSCGRSTVVKEVTYDEFGAEFLPQVVERFTKFSDKPVDCRMVHVLWVLEARIPPDPNNAEQPTADYYSVLCLCEGKLLGSGKESWRLLQMNRVIKNGRVVWNQAFRVDTTNEGEYRGARNYTSKPTLEQFNLFVERARLDKELAFRVQMLDYSKNKSHMFYVEAKAYPDECYDIFGSTPDCLKKVTLTWHADEPKPDIKLPAETKRSGFLDKDE